MKAPLPPSAILASLDVSALYTNIPQEEGLEVVREALYTRDTPKVPTEFIIRILEIVLKNNIFEFNNELWGLNLPLVMQIFSWLKELIQKS